MKKTVIQILVFLSLNSIAQIDIVNTSLIDSSKNILYIGIDNKIKINVTKESNKKNKLKSINSEISNYIFQNEINTFIVRPKQQGKDTLYVYNGDKYIFKKEFKIERIGDLKCILGKNLSSKLKIESIIENPSLNLFIPNCYLKRNDRVISFEVYKKSGAKTIPLYNTAPKLLKDTIFTVDIETGKEKTNIKESVGTITKNSGNRLTNYQIDETRKLKKGDFLLFENIIVNCPSGSARKMPNMEIEIL